jgi:hypothetical protein
MKSLGTTDVPIYEVDFAYFNQDALTGALSRNASNIILATGVLVAAAII